MRASALVWVAVGVVCGLVVESAGSVPVYLMLPLTTVTQAGLQNPEQLRADLAKLKAGGLSGVMVDVWWGLVEPAPKAYNWTAYRKLVDLVSAAGLKLQTVMSFHRCGGNVGDTCDIPLPSWVLSIGAQTPAIFYTDREGRSDASFFFICKLAPSHLFWTCAHTACISLSLITMTQTSTRSTFHWEQIRKQCFQGGQHWSCTET